MDPRSDPPTGAVRGWLVALLLLFLQGAAGTQERPDVLLLVVDDLNDWIGPLGGHPQARTPNLDRLAARGLVFTNAHCPAPICVPSRTAAFTGILPHVSGITGNGGNFREVHPDTVTLPQLLAAAGYHTLGAGKLFHFPDDASFARTALTYVGLPRDEPEPSQEERVDLGKRLTWGPLDVDVADLPDHAVADWLIERLREPEGEGPRLLAGGFHRPHVPWYVPRAELERLELAEVRLPEEEVDDRDDLPEDSASPSSMLAFHRKVLERDGWAGAVRAYLAAISFVDSEIGRVLDALEETGRAERTLVVLWSDHGFHLGEKGHWKKSTLWEESTRVPLLLAGPGVPAGARNGHAVSLVDLYRTVASLCDVPVAEGIGGFDLVPLLHDPHRARPEPVLIQLWQHFAVRTDDWHYVRYVGGGQELYDMRVDPGQRTNLARDPGSAKTIAELTTWIP